MLVNMNIQGNNNHFSRNNSKVTSMLYIHVVCLYRYNSLTILKEHELSGLESLELLMLHSNTIQTIEDRAFRDLKALQVKDRL